MRAVRGSALAMQRQRSRLSGERVKEVEVLEEEVGVGVVAKAG